MAFSLSMNASEIDKTLVESRRLLDSDPATKQYVDEKVANAGGSADLSEILEETEATTWTTKGEEAAIIVPMYDGGTVSLYKMPSAVGTVLPQEIEVTTKEVYDDGYVNEDVYLTEAHEAFRGEGVTLFDLQPVGIIAVVTKAGTVDFTDAQVEIPEPGVYFYDKRSWENPIEGVQYATMKFTTPYSEVRLKESILPATAATKQYVDDSKAELLDITETDTWTTEGKTAAFSVDLGGASASVYSMPEQIKPLLSVPVSVNIAAGSDGVELPATLAETAINECVTEYRCNDPQVNIYYASQACSVELDGMVLNFPSAGLFYLDVIGLSGGVIITFTFASPYTVQKLKEDLLPESVKGGSGGVVYVTVEANAETGEITGCGMFFPEIKEAYEEGKAIMATLPFVADPTILPLTAIDVNAEVAYFSAALVVSGYPYFLHVDVGTSISGTSLGVTMLATTTP